MKRVLLGLVCLLSLVSCKKGPVTVVYLLGISAEATHLDPNYYSLDPREIGAVIDRAVLSMDPKDVPAEDEHRIAEFNAYLPKLQEIEASYRKRIEGLEKREGVSFRIHGKLLLLKAQEDSQKDGYLKEYPFELKYN